MAKRRRKTPNQIAYQKELNRIKRYVRRYESKGYRFEKLNIPTEKPKVTRKRDIERLRKLTSENLLKKATAISEKTGKVISGIQRAKEERSAAAKRAAETRKRKKQVAFERERIKQDYIDKQKALQGNFNEGELIYNQIRAMIKKFPLKGALLLEDALASEIRRFGINKVILALSQTPQDMLARAEYIIFYLKDSAAAHTALKEFFQIITGEILRSDQSKKLGDTLDALSDMTFEYVDEDLSDLPIG